MIGYLRDHWQGRQALWQSFWINLVALRFLIFYCQDQLLGPETLHQPIAFWTFLLGCLVLHGVLFVWQIVGVIKATERHFAENGTMAIMWGAQLAGVMLFFLSASYGLQLYQATLPFPEDNKVLQNMAAEHASRYELSIQPNNTSLLITGSIELGITKAVDALLTENPSIKVIELTSPGGNIYEGRGLANQFRQRKLTTRIKQECASACTIAFIGGAQRQILESARLGFHQYRVDADYEIIVTNVEDEIRKDQQRFTDAGVKPEFVSAMFNRVADEMWWPDNSELLKARVVHEIIQQ